MPVYDHAALDAPHTRRELGMSDDLLDRAKAAIEGVTPGPWQIDWYICRADNEDVKYEKTRTLEKGEVRKNLSPLDELWRKARAVGPFSPDHDHWSGWTIGGDEADARFIAASRSLVPEMIAEIERLRTEVAQIETAGAISIKTLERWATLADGCYPDQTSMASREIKATIRALKGTMK